MFRIEGKDQGVNVKTEVMLGNTNVPCKDCQEDRRVGSRQRQGDRPQMRRMTPTL